MKIWIWIVHVHERSEGSTIVGAYQNEMVALRAAAAIRAGISMPDLDIVEVDDVELSDDEMEKTNGA